MIHNQPYMQPQRPTKPSTQYRSKPQPHPTLHPPQPQSETQSFLSQSQHSGISQGGSCLSPVPSVQEVAAQLALLAHRVNSHDRRLGVVEARKQQMGTWSSESGLLSQAELSSKQLEPYSCDHQEVLGRLREELEAVRGAKRQIMEAVGREIEASKADLTEELIGCFRESLSTKFMLEQQKISLSIQELGKAFEKRLTQSGSQLREEIAKMRDSLLGEAEKRWSGHRERLHPSQGRFRESKKDEVGEGACELRLVESWCAVGGEEFALLREEETCYFVDSSGCLLDSEHYYIVDGEDRPVRLSAGQMEHLEYLGMVRPSPGARSGDV